MDFTPRSVAALLFVGLFALPAVAYGQSCCSSTGSAQFGIVGRCQNTAFSVDLTHRQGVGSFGADGGYRSIGNAVVSDIVLKVGGGSRLGTDNWQFYGSLPIRRQHRDLGGLEPSTTVGLGDASVGMRWTVSQDLLSGIDTDDPQTWRPFVDLYLGAGLPTGRSYEQSEEPSLSDVMGVASMGLEAGARVTKFVTESSVLIVDVSLGWRASRDVVVAGETVQFDPGQESALALEWLELLTPRWSLGGGGGIRWTGRSREGGRFVVGSRSRRLQIQGYVTRTLVPMRSEMIVSLGSDAWWDQGGRNVPFAGTRVSVGYRRYRF